MAYAAVFAAAVADLLAAARLTTDAHVGDALGRRQAAGQSVASVAAFTGGWNLALVIFAVHLLVLGYLVARAAA